MPALTITVKNAELVRRNLQDLHREIPRISKHHLENAAKRIVKMMKQYPPERPGQKYRRTYKLANSWKISPTATGYKVSGDPVSRGRHYAPYVVGDARGKIGGGGQAWMHVGRWLLYRDVVEQEMTKIPDYVDEHLRKRIKQAGLS